jgi:hypothetical protein
VVLVEAALVSAESIRLLEDDLFFLFLVLDELFALGIGEFGEVNSFFPVIEGSNGPLLGLIVVLRLLDDEFNLVVG